MQRKGKALFFAGSLRFGATRDDDRAGYEAAQSYVPATVASDTDSATADTSCDSQAPSDSDTSP